MSIIRVGSNAKFADGWEKAFGKGKGGKSTASKQETKQSPKKAAKKAAKKKK